MRRRELSFIQCLGVSGVDLEILDGSTEAYLVLTYQYVGGGSETDRIRMPLREAMGRRQELLEGSR